MITIMKTNNFERTSKYISLLLRHKPEAAGLTLDAHGWADVDELLRAIKLDRADLERIVSEDKKGRYSFSEDGKFIRANQGHSVNVDVELEEKAPPETLYHGTAERFSASIEREGLKPGNRLYVHLSLTPEDARKVGQRHGKPAVYSINSAAMFRAGWKFYLSVNGVWLTKEVPAAYLARL